MVEEAYVSFEVAKLLKEKGFNGFSKKLYKPNGKIKTVGWKANNEWIESHVSLGCCSVAPTQQMAMRWLRENYGINLKAEEKCFCETSHDGMRVKKLYWHWCPEIQLLRNTKIHEGLVSINSRMEINADSYEDAIDKGIEWILENLV